MVEFGLLMEFGELWVERFENYFYATR
jgi:hypothetical protein